MLRSALTGGPAFLTWNGLTIQLHDDWQVEVEEVVEERRTNLDGLASHGLSHRIATITGKPVAVSTNVADLMTKLHPYKASDRGKLLSTVLGGANLPAVIQTMDGRSITFSACFLTQMPEMTFAPNVDVFGDVTWTCILAESGTFATLANFVAEASSAFTAPALNPVNLISERYNLSWGSTAPFDAIETDTSGIVLRPTLDTTELSTQKAGLLDWRINDVTAEVEFTPVNLTSANFNSLIATVARGKAMSGFGQALTVQQTTGTGSPKLVAGLAVPITKSQRFSMESRVGAVTMRLERPFDPARAERYTLSVHA
jgi:hypothetical protein